MRKKNRQKKTKRVIRRVGVENTKSSKKTRTIFYAEGTSDRLLFGITAALTILGLMMIASAGVIFGLERFDDEYYFFKRQLIGVGLGMVVLLVLERIDYHFLRRWSLFIFLGAVLLLIAVLLPEIGVKAYGAQRWISIGSVTFQPAEAVKLAMILYVSAWCASKGVKRISDISEGFVPFLAIVGSIAFLIILQPDVGTLGIIVLTAMSIFFLAGANLTHISVTIFMGMAMLFALIRVEQYRMQRFLTFLNPEADPLGAGYHITQAAIAIGSGGLFGLGFGHSRQKQLFLPEPVGDSIFAVIAEEFGLLGSSVLICMFALLAWRIFYIAAHAPDLFGRLVAAGIGVWLVGQAFINIAAISGLMPLTGIPLSFVSFGGTSMVFGLAAIGILLNISRQSKT